MAGAAAVRISMIASSSSAARTHDFSGRTRSDRARTNIAKSRAPSIRAAMVDLRRPTSKDEFEDNPQINGSSSNGSINGTKKIPLSSQSEQRISITETEDCHEHEHLPVSVEDYMKESIELTKTHIGPPRWFCPLDCGRPSFDDAPLLLFLPGMDGTGLGLIRHHRTLGPLFEVRCLHIPVQDRTPFEGLLKIVESAVIAEHGARPTRPIYLVGDSFGSTLALAVAARNPAIDLVLILANPATSIARSPLQPLFPVLALIPENAFHYVPYLLSFAMGNPIRLASAKIAKEFQEPFQDPQKLADALTGLLPVLPDIARIIPKNTLLWKLKLVRAGALYANSRLHAVKAEVFVLAGEKDQLLPSVEEARRLKGALKNCKIRIFKESGHTILLEDGPSLATIIKCRMLYRRSKQRDAVDDYVPPTKEELEQNLETINTRVLRGLVSPVFLSTTKDGQVIKDLSAVPDEQPLLLVGNHMLMGLELSLIVGEFFKQKKVIVRGLAHPMLFTNELQSEYANQGFDDQVGLFGATPVSGKNFYKLLASKSSVLLYPGGAREALHMKGEEYKLFWPEQSEFVRMAARFGATIVPFSCVGEDDMVQLLLDYEDLRNNSFLRERLVLTPNSNLRPPSAGEVANQPLYLPVLAPKIPGRFYCLFGKPIRTTGRFAELQDRQKAMELYLQVKLEVESGISYLLDKRNQDPYRAVLPRLIYEASWAGTRRGPTFDP